MSMMRVSVVVAVVVLAVLCIGVHAEERGAASSKLHALKARVESTDASMMELSVEAQQKALGEAFLSNNVAESLAAMDGAQAESFSEAAATGPLEAFKKFLARNGRKYRSATAAKEIAVWTANIAKVALLNARKLLTGIEFSADGPFGHLTKEQWKAQATGARPPPRRSMLEAASEAKAEGDFEVLFEETAQAAAEAEAQAAAEAPFNFVAHASPIKQQSPCGSCAHHSAVETYETHLAWRGTPMQIYAPQWLLDCQPNNNKGCGGSDVVSHFEWMQSNGGVLESEYKYTGEQGKCRKTSGSGPKLGGLGWHLPACYTDTCKPNEAALLASLRKNGPGVVYVDSNGWQLYKSGILGNGDCTPKFSATDHAVVLMGYGVDKGKEYWLVRNHWSANWGEKGYIRLAYGVNACGVANFAPYPILAAAAAPKPAPATAKPTPAPAGAKACAVSAPAGGAMGDCPASLASGKSCQLACNQGYVRSGAATSCSNGALAGQSCAPKSCDVVAPADGTLGNCPASMAHGASCDFACKPGYKLKNSPDKTTCNLGTVDPQKCAKKLLGFI